MSRLVNVFKELNGRKGLIPFVTAGHPHPNLTVTIMHQLVTNGADVIELGMPFSDPMADGPVIQQSSESAIKLGIGIDKTVAMVKQFRENDNKTPVVLMGYLNPVECMGHEQFVKAACDAGVDALLLVDSPPEESADLLSQLRSKDLEQIFLVAPTTTESRMSMICDVAAGFVYYVALKGVTGSADLEAESVNTDIRKIKQHTNLPVAVGFGVKDASSAVAVAQEADAVVIGSALVAALGNCEDDAETSKVIADFIKPIRTALDSL